MSRRLPLSSIAYCLGLALIAAFSAAAAATPRHRPAVELVVTVTGEGEVLVGLGEPPAADRLGALVYVAGGGSSLPETLATLREAVGGAPAARRFAARGAPPDEVAAVDASLAGFTAAFVDPADDGPDAGAQMTADHGGYHRRDAPGSPAPDAKMALAQLLEVSSYGHGHGEPMFEPAGGAMRQVRAQGWDQPTQAYACPFPSTPDRAGPVGMAVELSLAGGRSASEEALASWCERSAHALATHCAADEVIAAFELGVVESSYGQAPPTGPWWLSPEHVGPSGGSTMPVACAADALGTVEIAGLHADLVLRFRLIEDDLATGCRREIDESCK